MGRLAYHPLGPGHWPYTSTWRPPHRPGHRGVDIGVIKSPLYAPMNGVATRGNEPGGAGYWVNVTNGAVTTKCFHMSRIDIANGERVTAGQLIGRSGGVPGEPGAGNTTGAHLHFELWEGGRDIDPAPDLAAIGATPVPEPDQEEDDEMSAEQADRIIKHIDDRLEQVAVADRAHMAAIADQRAAIIIEAIVRADADNATEEQVTQKRDELLAVVLPRLGEIDAELAKLEG